MKYVLGGLFAVFFLVRVISVIARSRSDQTSPGGVAKRLTATGRHVVTVPAGRYVWNPAQLAGSKNRVEGPGTATYTLVEGAVTLDFAPDGGQATRYSGKLPEGKYASTAVSLPATLAAPVVGLLTAAVAAVIEGGSLADHVTLVAIWGIAGWIGASIVMMATNQVIRTQAFAANRAH